MTRPPRTLALVATLAVLAAAGAGSGDEAEYTRSRTAGRPSPSPAPVGTPTPPRLPRKVLDRQDRVTRAHRHRETRAHDRRPLLAHLPLERDGVRIDIAGLAADHRSTILTLTGRSPSRARRAYRTELARHGDTGRAYRARWRP